ncbi:putative membrane protein [Marinimicrobium koreense]|jgi:uncharacterized membrane protein|uniref:Putative membrane protein n=2 Tax=Cellvibrionaceae TaxID=1706371 RepID=A0A3N1NZC3_9GAMM|nr:putative membrane protein [Marinimicrobium koreense]
MVINGKAFMKRWQSFVGLTLLGGLMVALPIAIFIFILQWLLGLVTAVIAPISAWLASWAPLAEQVADLLGIVLVLGAFFLIGLAVKTSIGRWIHNRVDQWLTRFAPGYSTIREVVMQFLGGENNTSLLRGQVCRAYIMGRQNPVSVTAIVTARHSNGDCTVYVPTAPIPSSGFVYHLTEDCVELLPHISVEAAMRTVISCGSGSQIISDPPEPAPEQPAASTDQP